MRKQFLHIANEYSKSLTFLLILLLSALHIKAQTIGGNVYGGGEKGEVAGNGNVTIKSGTLGSLNGIVSVGGNVYGGGNLGNLLGQTTVTLQGGNIFGDVFGGAQQANVGKYAYVNIDGRHQLHDLTVNRIFGGNDISGHVGESLSGSETKPFETEVDTVSNKFQAFIQATPENADEMDIFIGQMFGGGNGDYTYSPTKNNEGVYEAMIGDSVVATSETAFTAPTVGRTYMQINGGTYGYVYAGGNAATVTKDVVISINDSSTVTTATDSLNIANMSTVAQMMAHTYDPKNPVDQRLKSMGLNISTFQPGRHFSRIFGGNNKADMAIMPMWNLAKGSAFDLYSGGNEGNMVCSNGILLEIPKTSTMDIINAFGGCRKGDVRPQDANGNVVTVSNPAGYNFPNELSARILVRGGTVQNVYGGNDIKGKVWGGTAVGVYTSISGDVYGGGNGSYAYTDNEQLKNDVIWGDYYYDKGSSSIDSLNANRPNVEQVSLRLFGESNKKTIIGGSVYVGGNSCTLVKGDKEKPTVELKIGSHVIADNVFLGNNGENMIDSVFLKRYASSVTDDTGNNSIDYSSLNLTSDSIFAKYMEGAASVLMPSIVFDNKANGDPADYEEYTTFFGSLFCGGNIGSMIYPGTNKIDFNNEVVIYNKLVGGCNNANIAQGTYNAAYKGGILGTSAETDYTDESGNIKDRLVLNLNGLRLAPLRWKVRGNDYQLDANNQKQLEYNVVSASSGNPIYIDEALSTGTSTATDLDRRLKGGNVYGGCYNSGHINGNVIINLNSTIVDRDRVFDIVQEENGEPKLDSDGNYNITTRKTGVILHEQCMDALGSALNVFGGGYGEDSEVWGSATVNLKKGYTFQIFGGGEHGAIGKADNDGHYTYDSKYSTYVNLCDENYSGVPKGHANDNADIAECAVMYGGGFEGLVTGDTHVDLANGRIYNSFGGSCNADILGHTETYIGKNGFPYARDYIYGGNDLGGKIFNKDNTNFIGKVSDDAKTKVFTYNSSTNTTPDVTKASAYVEYQKGHADRIFGGCYGDYDYTVKYSNYARPCMDNAFVNFRPVEDNNVLNGVQAIFGAGQGHETTSAYEIQKDTMQARSYVLVDIPSGMDTFKDMSAFGGGAYCGLGMGIDTLTALTNATGVEASAVVDLMRGQISAAYGGSYQQGFTRRTFVNVPTGSTINVGNIFGGAYGADLLIPCDVYEAKVNYSSSDATTGAIYGGNNFADRTLYTQVNINSKVWSDREKGNTANIYGAGLGENSWAQYTEVNLNDGAEVYKVYGGGNNGKVLNTKTLDAWKAKENTLDLTMTPYVENGLENALAKETSLGGKYNTNVHIKEGAIVSGYAYGGGYGAKAVVSGTTYVDLLGGTVNRDIYGAGESGGIYPLYDAQKTDNTKFTATSNVYIEGGMARNVYGGGWKGSVGYHGDNEYNSTNDITTTNANDILAETHVTIGKLDGDSYLNGIPAIQRNAYAGGEGGSVFGTANITVNNGYIGYYYDTANTAYNPQIDDAEVGDKKLEKRSGNVFGGGYIINSFVDNSVVKMYDGTVRGSLFGGGEIGPIGRGTVVDGSYTATHVENGDAKIFKAGTTLVGLYGGKVMRNVFGGGRGYDNWGGDGTKFMDEDVIAAADLNVKGDVFGQTQVHIHGGEVGTAAGVEQGLGNVFGGGDEGVVYSAYQNASGILCMGKKFTDDDGYYYKFENGSYSEQNSEKIFTEDCKVLIEPHTKVTTAVTIKGHNYVAGEYVPTADLNTLGTRVKDSSWGSLDVDGITIHNAVFAGGNVSSGSDQVYANATTVYGNATASIHDVFSRDLISIGTDHIGGIYGDGNLTMVDGYRELNITNYGTDYYSLNTPITKEVYDGLYDREKAYYELCYKCNSDRTDNEGTTYKEGSTLSRDQIITLFKGKEDVQNINNEYVPNSSIWIENGVRSLYAGRIMNTIQRADFCGVFGSRMVLQGAQDRVPEVVDYTNYTINRVGEVSLNKVEVGDSIHGNYFGIYNKVNYLGALTSDVKMSDIRTSNNTDKTTYQASIPEGKYGEDGYTFYNWKKAHPKDRIRNNGNSHNQVALASGVYLELTTEKSTGTELNEKNWGYITGVVELDLIDVQPGIGGGFVYAKNEHGVPSSSGLKHTTLTALNTNAVSKAQYIYTTTDNSKVGWETSGNFVHSTQTIIDDCYNISDKYTGTDAVPAHYWFIKGQVYVYDQYISAYTGAPNAYSETVNIPLTITAASHGTMKLLNVQPNLYAYYKNNNGEKLGDSKLVINDVTYQKNSPINYWDWNLLSNSEKSLFVKDTYVTIADCKIGETEYKAGYVMLPSEYNELKNDNDSVYHVEKGQNVDFDYVFRSSNNLSHNTGYILTYDVNNPVDWNNWYTKIASGSPRTDKKNTEDYGALSDSDKANYTDGPTYRLKDDAEASVYGQRSYEVTDVISKKVYDDYQSITSKPTDGQAAFETAYIVTSDMVTTNKKGVSQNLYKDATIAKSDYTDNVWTTMSGSVTEAYVCTSTIQLSKTEYIYANARMTLAEKNAYIAAYNDNETLKKDIEDLIVPAYYCTTAGLYGGKYYEKDKNYRGLEAWSSMSADDRTKFTFNYDALDLLIDPLYSRDEQGNIIYSEGRKYQYDGNPENTSDRVYSSEKPVDYTATYDGSENLTLTTGVTLKRGETTLSDQTTVQNGDELSRENYESIPNEQRHYTAITVEDVNKQSKYYVAKDYIQHGNTIYAPGQTITAEIYNSLGDQKTAMASEITFTVNGTYYYCRESYTGTVTSATGVSGATSCSSGEVPVGVVIAEGTYTQLPNQQKNFTIHGIAPTETSTLFVSRNSDIFDLSTEKIITVVYQYDYEESDTEGKHITPVSERHIVNIHINFKSGVPSVDDITEPGIVLPGTSVTVRTPEVTPGAYEVTGGGWELFETETDAESHTNAIPYVPSADPLYLYQDDYYIAYYALTYLGKTYSNHVKVSVANYHDLLKVMNAKNHHYYIDKTADNVYPKIYINDYTSEGKNGLDLFKNLFDLSMLDANSTGVSEGKVTTEGDLKDHALLDPCVKAGEKLKFYLRTDIDHDSAAWTPIANNDGECFEGTLHGDGYKITGLDHSLFNHLCGDVYNLGVTGKFTTAGVALTGSGYAENCWVKTSNTEQMNTYPIIGNPTKKTGFQIVNCYYPSNNIYNENCSKGNAIKKSPQAFYNGEVAYDLNDFYLFKRYNDNKAGLTQPIIYKYFDAKDLDNEGQMKLKSGKYIAEATTADKYVTFNYVEDRFADGDFIYAGGTIPETADERLYIDDDGVKHYYPIWPDDYIFFGQTLNYGHSTTQAHQDLPSRINKTDNRLASADKNNRVYRAPAYFSSSAMDVAHFNANAIFAKTKKDDTDVLAYKGMTAIDFSGCNDVTNGYKQGDNGGFFYQPLLDDDGLTSFKNIDLTSNLLAYTMTDTSAGATTDDVITTYLAEPTYSDYYSNDKYRKVAKCSSALRGHHVRKNAGGSTYTAPIDHFLVDKEDFNAPISYTFASGKRMWYQRIPDTFVDTKNGWEGISIPFSAELVTTQDKGEITHFYQSSNSVDDNGTKIGNEYWLREYEGGAVDTENNKVFKAVFNYPKNGSNGNKVCANTFLWDYYYSKNPAVANNAGKDKNTDIYQTYYKTSRTYNNYAYNTAGKPYIIGFPGTTYYEFDLSGGFNALHTYEVIGQLAKQTITFASDEGATIAVSDDEQTAAKVKDDGYTFMPNYLSTTVAAENYYTLDSDGNSYDVTAEPVAVPFRPYFIKENTSSNGRRSGGVEYITFSNTTDIEDLTPHEGESNSGGLNIYAKRGKIVVKSSRKTDAIVHIMTISGLNYKTFTIKPGEVIETPVNVTGIYIVNAKKLRVEGR